MPNDITDLSTPADVYSEAASANAPQPLPDALPQPAAPATSTPDQGIGPSLKQAFEGASVKYQVPVNVLMAIGPQDGGRGIAPSSTAQPSARGIVTPGARSAATSQAIDGMAQQLRGALDKGGSIEDAVRASGYDPSTIIPAAKQIAARLYPLPSPAGQTAAQPPKPKRQGAGSFIADQLKTIGGGIAKGTGILARGLSYVPEDPVNAAIDWITGSSPQMPEDVKNGVADALEKFGSHIQAGASQAQQQAEQGSQPNGSLLHPTTWSLGTDPSLRGYMAMGEDLLGQAAPAIAGMIVSGGSEAVGAGIGALQAGGAAVEQAIGSIHQMAKNGTLARQSPYYSSLLRGGMRPADAVEKVADSAGKWAFLMAAPAGVIGGAVASKVVHPASELASHLNLIGRVAARAGLGAADMSAQNVAQTAAGNEGQNLGAGTDTPVMQGAGAAAVRGLITGAALGAGGGLLSRQAPGTAPENAPAAEPAPQPSTGNPGIDAGLAGTPPGFEPAPVPQRPGEEPISQARTPDGALILDKTNVNPSGQPLAPLFLARKRPHPAPLPPVTPGPVVHPASVGQSPASPLSNALARAVPARAAGVSAPDAMAGGNQPSAGDRAAALAAWQAAHRRPDPQPASAASTMEQASVPDQAAAGARMPQAAGVPTWAQKYRRDEAASGAGQVIPAIGSRVAIRHSLPGDHDHSFEIIGNITAVDHDMVTVRDDDGEGYQIPRADLESGQAAGGSLTIAPHEDDWGRDLHPEVRAHLATQAEAARKEKWAEVDRVLDAQGTGLRDWLDDRGYLDPSKRSGR